MCSKLVGEQGKVIGVDMTPDQLEKARKHIDYHTKLFGYSSPNVEFVQGLCFEVLRPIMPRIHREYA